MRAAVVRLTTGRGIVNPRLATLLAIVSAGFPLPQTPQGARFDDAPARAGEWGWQPPEGAVLDAPLRAFCWRPQAEATRYRVQVARDACTSSSTTSRSA